jgi:secreted PhoX family phosphatase
MDRRTFLGAFAAAAAGTALAGPAAATQARPGRSPFGPLKPADRNGIRLPRGFRSRVVARSGQPVGSTGYTWHTFPDGGATFKRPGGWTYVCNSEVPVPGGGGAGQLHFDGQGRITGANPVLVGTTANCSGGRTPWRTWLSGEEHPLGMVHECTVDGPSQGVARPALGIFAHEMVTVDPNEGRLYLTEDDTTVEGDEFYRFTPTNPLPDLSAGTLEVLRWTRRTGAVTWVPVDATTPSTVRRSLGGPHGTAFDGNEGVWYDRGHVYFTVKSNNRVYDLDVARQRLTVLWDAARYDPPVLSGVDNLVMDQAHNLYVAEDGGNMELVLISARGHRVAPFLRVTGQSGSEITGPAFTPGGRRLYFSSQRGGDAGTGITYEVTGPFPARR